LRKYTTDQEIAARRLVVQEANEWPGTPFIPRQLRDWMLAGKKLEDPYVFRKFIERFAMRIEYVDRLPGDLVTFLYLGVECHVGIFTERDPDWMVDAVTRGTVRRRRLQAINSLEAVYRHNFFTGSKAVAKGLGISTVKESREALRGPSRSSQAPERA
jgi:hypothetical protein